MAIETDDDARFIAEKIRDGTLTGARKEAAFLALQEFRSGAPTREQRQVRITDLETEQAAVEADKPSFLRDVVGQTIADIRGVPEAALDLAISGAATTAGGVAAIPVTAIEALRGGEDPAGAGRAVIERFQDIGAAQEIRTDVGKRAAEAIAAPLESLEQFADVAGEVTGDPEDVLGATLVKTAILGAPALFGARRGVVTKRPAAKPTPRQEVARVAAEEGYVTPPSVRGEAGAAGLAEGIGGKIKTGQQAIETNQAVTNKLANRAVGLPEDVPLSVDILRGIRAEAGKAFEAVSDVGRVFTDNRFNRDLSAATRKFKNAARDFPELAKNEIIDLVDSLRVSEFNAGAGVDAMSLLRNRADVAFRNGDKALGNSYRAASNAIEGVLERHLARGESPALLDQFRQARQQIAETYSVEEALQARITGEVNASNLAAQLKKGKPLSGDLRAIADFANTFPSVSKLFIGTAQKFSPIDLGVAAISGTGAIAAGALGAGPVGILPAVIAGVSRPLLRKGALSEVARRAGVAGESTTPTAGALLGGAAGAVLAEDQR